MSNTTTPTKTAHTAGPWVAGGWSSNGTPVFTAEPGRHAALVAVVHSPDYGWGRMFSTAEESVKEGKRRTYLIESAPDLLAALEGCIERMAVQQTRQPGEAFYYREDVSVLADARAAIAKAKGVGL